MGRPSPAVIVGGARCSLRTFRASRPLGAFRPASTCAGSSSRANSRRKSSTSIPSVTNMLRKELRIIEQLPNSSRTFATVLPDSLVDEYEQQEAHKEDQKTDTCQEDATTDAQEPLDAPEEYDRWTAYNSTDPSSSQAVFRRRSWPDAGPLQEGQQFYEEVQAYRKHFNSLMEAEIVQATDQVVERLSQWDLKRLITEGYTVDNLSAFPYIKKGEKNPGGYIFSFVPPAGDCLGVNLFMRGSQVTVIDHGESPLKYRDPGSSRIETLQGTVLYSSSEEIRVGFGRSDLKFLAERRWRLDVYVSEIGHQRMRAAIEALNYDPGEMQAVSSPLSEYELHGTYLRKELLEGIVQGVSTSSGDTSTEQSSHMQSLRRGLFTLDERIDDWVRRHSQPTPERREGDPELLLNASQTQAVAQMIGERFSLVQGPPGTGKTQTIIQTIRLLKAHFQVPHPILVCTYTNAAVDNLVEGLAAAGLRPLRVGNEASIKDEPSQWSLHDHAQKHRDWAKLVDLKRELDKKQSAKSRTKVLENGTGIDDLQAAAQRAVDRESLDMLKKKVRKLEMSIQYHVLRSADVVCTTCLTAGSRPLRLMDFPAVFLDEASMSTEPASLIPLMLGSQHVALIGDHKQLPPVISSTLAQEGGLSRSLFERLIEQKKFPSTMLNTQYRMHPSISAFPSKEFYNMALKNGTVSETGVVQSNLSPPRSRHLSRRASKVTGQVPSVLFIHHDHRETAHDRSRANVEETRIVIAVIEDLLISNPEMKGKDIGIISPYVAQIRRLESMLKTDLEWEESFRARLGDLRALQIKDIEVKTVDGFEGREKEVIIFSTVRNNPWGQIGFLADRRRMNVALTRAKRALFVLGSMTTLSKGRYGSISEDPKKEVAKMVMQSTGDEWKNFIKFVLAEEWFTEFDRPPEYRSQEEILAFERDCTLPMQWENRALVAT